MAPANRMTPPETLVEEGTAFEALSEKNPARKERERVDVVVIGGGQAGLSVGYHLMKRGMRFVILDGSARVGDTWRKRWDSLRLFTPAWLDSLDGLPFPAPPDYFPTKDEMGDYLELYAKHFKLPVRSDVKVESVSRKNDRYLVQTSQRDYDAAARLSHAGPANVLQLSRYDRGKRHDSSSQRHDRRWRAPALDTAGPLLDRQLQRARRVRECFSRSVAPHAGRWPS